MGVDEQYSDPVPPPLGPPVRPDLEDLIDSVAQLRQGLTDHEVRLSALEANLEYALTRIEEAYRLINEQEP